MLTQYPLQNDLFWHIKIDDEIQWASLPLQRFVQQASLTCCTRKAVQEPALRSQIICSSGHNVILEAHLALAPATHLTPLLLNLLAHHLHHSLIVH